MSAFSISLSTWWRSVSLCVASSLCIMALAELASSYVGQEGPRKIDNEDCLQYRPDVDGLRAVAVIAVVVFHLKSSWLPGGWAGVDIFFVVSGYVVTGSLIRRRSISTMDGLATFYISRVKRLMPNSLCTTFMTALLVCLFIPTWMEDGWAAPLPKIHRAGTYSIFAAANICFGSTHQGYWETGTSSLEMNPYTHMWSLGVEEQFYLLYPMLLLLLHGQAPTPECLQASPLRSRVALGVCAAMSFAAYVHVAETNSEAAFYYLPFRFWELAVGGWLYEWQASCAVERWLAVTTHKVFHIPLEFCAISLIGAAICIPTMPEQTDLMRMTAAVLGTVCCIIANASLSGNLRRMMSITPLVSVGKMSYSIYLWHWPIFVIFRWTVGLDSVLCLVGALFLTAAFASVAYYCIEKPVRQWPCAGWKVLLFMVASVVFCQSSLALLSGSKLTAVPPLCEEPSESLNTSSFVTSLIHGQPSSRCACELDSQLMHVPPSAVALRPGAPLEVALHAGASTVPACFPDRVDALSAEKPVRKLLVVGDSHATSAANALKASQAVRAIYDVELLQLNCSGFTIDHACPDGRQQSDDFREQVFAEVETLQMGDVVVLVRFIHASFEPDLILTLRRAVVQERNASLIMYGDNPAVRGDMSRCVPTWINPNPSCEVTVEEIRARHSIFSAFAKKIANELPRTFYFERWPLYCDAAKCGVFIPGTCTLAYTDAHHPTIKGGIYSSPFMCSFMEEHGLL